MSASDTGKNGNISSNKPTDALPFGLALGQVAAAAQALEIKLEEKKQLELDLISENTSLRASGKKVIEELTELISKANGLEGQLLFKTAVLKETENEKIRLEEEIRSKDAYLEQYIQNQQSLNAAELQARENKLREEIAKIAKSANEQVAIEKKKLEDALTSTNIRHDTYRSRAVAEITHLQSQTVCLNEQITAEKNQNAILLKDFAGYRENAEKKIVELEEARSKFLLAQRNAHLRYGELSVRLEEKTHAAQTRIKELMRRLEKEIHENHSKTVELKKIREDAKSQLDTIQGESQAAIRKAHMETETSLQKAHFETQLKLEEIRSQLTAQLQELERGNRDLLAELEAERKRKYEAIQKCQEVERDREQSIRDSNARIRRLEEECGNLAKELKLTLDASERRISEIRTEAQLEKTRRARETAETLNETLNEAKAREDEARARALTSEKQAEKTRLELEALKRDLSQSAQGADSDLFKETCQKLRAERDDLLRMRAQERATFQTEIARLRAELEILTKNISDIRRHRKDQDEKDTRDLLQQMNAQMAVLRWEKEERMTNPELTRNSQPVTATPAREENPLLEVLRQKEIEIEQARSRVSLRLKEENTDN